MGDFDNQISSPKSVESSSSSKFKTLKKKIRNKFRLSRTEDTKTITIAQAVEALKHSNEILSLPPQENSEQLKNEYKGKLINFIYLYLNKNNLNRIEGDS